MERIEVRCFFLSFFYRGEYLLACYCLLGSSDALLCNDQ